MADIFEIPVNSDVPAFSIRTELELVVFILHIAFNERRCRWILSVFDSDEVPLCVGIPLNINADLIGRFVDDRLPPGIIMLFDSFGENAEAGRDDLGSRARLLYQESV